MSNMKKSLISRLWYDPVWSKVIAAGVLIAVAAIWASFKGLWPSIGAVPVNIWGWLGKETAVSNWLVVLLSIGSLVFILGLVIVAWAVVVNKTSSEPWQSYTKDEFFGIKWRWDYGYDRQIDTLTSYCPACDYQVYATDTSFYSVVPQTTYKCEDCGQTLFMFNGTDWELKDRVKRKIQKKLRDSQRQVCTDDSN